MPDLRPFLMPVSVTIAGVAHAGTYVVVEGTLTVTYGAESMAVDLGEAGPGKRAEEVLAALVKRARRKPVR